MAFEMGNPGLPGGWSWPADIPPDSKVDPPLSERDSSRQSEKPSDTRFASESKSSTHPSSSESRQRRTAPTPKPNTEDSSQSEQPRPPKEKHWRPRTCRICLDTVNPTFHPQSDSLPGVLQGSPRVTYEDEAGRLISPCKCKGSSRYVHESCLQQWRHSDPSFGTRNYWNCPTCGFRYRLERMQWGHWISSTTMQIALTFVIFMTAVFLFGFIADPIINLYVDPLGTVSSIPMGSSSYFDEFQYVDKYEPSWFDHFMKGFASLGLLGFVKVLFSMSPWHWFNLRSSGLMGSRRSGNTGRDRLQSISWIVVLLGVCTFLYTVWKAVRAWSRRFLQRAGERVMDVNGGDNNFDDDDDDD